MKIKKLNNMWVLTYQGITVQNEVLETAQALMIQKMGEANV